MSILKKLSVICLLSYTLGASCRMQDSFFDEMHEMMNEMQKMHDRMFDRLFNHQVDDEDQKATEVSKKRRANIAITESSQDNTAIIKVTTLELKDEQPNASVHMNPERKEINIEIPVANGSLAINYHNSLIATTLNQKKSAESGRSASSMQQATILHAKPDFQTPPSISYNKEQQELTVVIKTQSPDTGLIKQDIPIAIK